ncbi:hypothetical protein OCU04_008493 [Sclerotinia nivalis]|uniref:Uncharacterized protein n=1 Tax=Sclerotinia nivalis TaxID=352851 RepID=A0A9X0AI86_9HELO|nr:hypothetical protein OCU04_008493 [Sclerotinia nivalis]
MASNSNEAVDTDEKRLQREGSRRLGEGALGGTSQKKLGSNETGDRQGQQTFLLLQCCYVQRHLCQKQLVDYTVTRMVICLDSFILSTAFPKPSVVNNTPQILTCDRRSYSLM